VIQIRLLFLTNPKDFFMSKTDVAHFDFKIFSKGKENTKDCFSFNKIISTQESTAGTKKYLMDDEKYLEKSFGSEKQFLIIFKKVSKNLYKIDEIRFHFSLWEIYYQLLTNKNL
jgi:hypothetical protein